MPPGRPNPSKILESPVIFLKGIPTKPAPDEEKCQQNLSAIRKSKVLLGILINATINSGLEFGYAYGLGKPVVFLTAEHHEPPVMALIMYTEIFRARNLDTIHEYVEDLSKCLRHLCNM